ncbi:three-Cys-motif partner protein TcmP [Ruegeria sp.]|uniref:three-Cys-motif partner protein TcmP n=1 Tax=Ruegeria sp. TaxID=1879320 RepID=UPI003B00A7CE
MAEKRYKWADGAELEGHSHRKHKILREYVFDYLTVRCKLPQQERFRLAIIDGFSGGGRYKCGAVGSPLIFMEELKRAVQGLGTIEVECLLIFNDENRDAIELLKTNVAPLEAEIAQTCPKLHVRVEYLNQLFEAAYPKIKDFLNQGRYRNVLFNLDQYGDRHVERKTILDIMHSYLSAEIFYTFMISSLLAFLQKDQPEQLQARLNHLNVTSTDIEALDGVMMSNNDWLGAAEKLVFDAFRLCAPYVSPFSINNPGGWRYWLIHFANAYRARQVYNNILHDNASLQAHFGRSGLNMLSYDPRHDGMLYLFDDEGRASAKDQLLDDIPHLVTESGDAISVREFYENIYNITPAHANDINAAIIENPDLEVITPAGGERRKPNTIGAGDFIKMKEQRSFFPMFLNAGTKGT